MLLVKFLSDQGGELGPEGLQGLLQFHLLEGSILFVPSHRQVLAQLRLNVLEQRDEGLHRRAFLHHSFLRLVPHHQRKSLLRVP